MKNQKGFTLVELVVGAGLVGMIGLILGALIIYSTGRYHEVRERLEAELAAARAENILRYYFSSAIAFDSTAAPGANVAGGILDFDWDQIADPGANWSLLATFWREDSTQRGGAATGGGTYGGWPRATAMWYRRPSRTTSGVLFIDGGNSRLAMQPSYNEQGGGFIDRLSTLQMTKVAHDRHPSLTAVDIRFTIRYHTSHSNGFNWCPVLDINANASGCGGAGPRAAIKDIERSFRILLQNNLLQPISTL